MERTVQIWLEDDLLEEFDFDFNDNMDEDSMIQAAVEYVFGNIVVEVI